VTMFSQYSTPQFEVEPVEVVSPDGRSNLYPDLSVRSLEVDVSSINGVIGVSLQAQEVGVPTFIHAIGDLEDNDIGRN
jgi:phenylalanyl-tRNA synthetase beta chain